jgi:hypothetical protein
LSSANQPLNIILNINEKIITDNFPEIDEDDEEELNK